MDSIFKYVSTEYYAQQVKDLKSGETKVIYESKNLKIKLRKSARKVYAIFVSYGDIPISEIAKNLVLVQA